MSFVSGVRVLIDSLAFFMTKLTDLAQNRVYNLSTVTAEYHLML